MPFPPDLPPHDQLADLMDTDGWDILRHGRMVEFASAVEPAVEVHDESCQEACPCRT